MTSDGEERQRRPSVARRPTGSAVLAAARAEAGDFDTAIKRQEMALGLLPDDAEARSEWVSRLELYKAKKPYHTPQQAH